MLAIHNVISYNKKNVILIYNMYDPVPRSHMFMIDARRLSGSGCCSSTQRVQEPVAPLVQQQQDPNDVANYFWNLYIQRHYPQLMRARIRSVHSGSPYYNNMIMAERGATHEWQRIYRQRQGTWTDENMDSEIERIAQALNRTIQSFQTNVSFNI